MKITCNANMRLGGKMDGKNVGFQLHDRIFSEEQMYDFVENIAKIRNFHQTEIALVLMKKYHEGQVRDGSGQVPYINHPLTMACHALALHVENDEMLAAILLHDVCEDCGVKIEELPVNENVREAVDRLTFCVKDGESRKEAKKRYYEKICENKMAALIKLIDRCNNISTMASGFTKQRMLKYIRETEEYILPLLSLVKNETLEWRQSAFLLEYQIRSILESLKRIL